MRKLFVPLFISLALAASPALAFTVQAEEEWSEAYYRVYDQTGELSDAERDDLDSECIGFMKTYGTDIALLSVTEADYEGSTLAECAKSCYETNGYGYGEDGSCIILICDVENEKAEFVTFGGAEGRIPQDYYDFVKSRIFGYMDEYGVYGVLYSSKRYLTNYLDGKVGQQPQADEASAEDTAGDEVSKLAPEDVIAEPEITTEDDKVPDASADAERPDTDSDGERPEAGADPGKPAWYVNDLSHFELFHDETAPRIKDDAGIFTPAEIDVMSDRLWEIRDELDKDIVIFTDTSTYGLERNVYAADYFEMNGYGTGDEHEGAVLFICMDPNDRGWYCSCMGSVTMGLYSEEVANAIDDELYEYMAAGTYGEGVADWIENFSNMYRRGNPFAPDWLEDGKRGIFRDMSGRHIDDTAHYLEDDEASRLEEHAKELSDRYGTDVVIHTASAAAAIGMTVDEYAEKYYTYNGYGMGDKKDGLVLVILNDGQKNTRVSCLYGEGGGLSNLTEVNRSRILGNINDRAGSNGEFYKAFDGYLDQLGSMYKTGRVPRTGWYWSLASILGLIGGLTTGGFSLSGARSKMETPAIKTDADMYLIADSMDISGPDRYVTSHTSRKYDPVVKSSSSSSGSSSSGRSSYSSSYSSSSGHSHSGSGRNF
ncbi:MAG: TPM domain-containing protein [Lachnospiraceae bacterium]|nr:TPM domain-containing protein [Lachnospiraceae bacterium]